MSKSRGEQHYPYKTLGDRLKRIREKSRETLAEVCGAVEIDIEQLHAFESGVERPSEDILSLLITHFSVHDSEADKLWGMAGYDNQAGGPADVAGGQDEKVALVMPMDLRIVYTDMVHVVVNDYGLVMNFMQTAGAGNKPLAIARVGMSREHAKSVLEVLQKTLAQSEPKQLPESSQKPAGSGEQDITRA